MKLNPNKPAQFSQYRPKLRMFWYIPKLDTLTYHLRVGRKKWACSCISFCVHQIPDSDKKVLIRLFSHCRELYLKPNARTNFSTIIQKDGQTSWPTEKAILPNRQLLELMTQMLLYPHWYNVHFYLCSFMMCLLHCSFFFVFGIAVSKYTL